MYSASTMGATIHLHYCMNQFAGWSFSSDKKEKCSKCGMKNTGCCKDEKKQFKLSSEQQKAEYAQGLMCVPALVTPISDAYLLPTRDLLNKYTFAQIHAPPLLLKNQTQSFLSIFLI
jgi:hypothetical protein